MGCLVGGGWASPLLIPFSFVFSYYSSFTLMSCISLPWYGVASPHASLAKAVTRY
jgi:hypothetical protein